MNARALEVHFRHNAPTITRKAFTESTVAVAGAEFPTDTPLILHDSQAPSWGVTGPTGFDFQYVVPEEERDAFYGTNAFGIVVKLYALFEIDGGWFDLTKYRFEGRITSMTYEPHNGLARCTATPLSRLDVLQPYVPGWSNQEQLDLTEGTDTLLRWTRAARRADHPAIEEI